MLARIYDNALIIELKQMLRVVIIRVLELLVKKPSSGSYEHFALSFLQTARHVEERDQLLTG